MSGWAQREAEEQEERAEWIEARLKRARELEEENEALRKRLESATMFRIHTAPIYINNMDVMRCEGHRLPKQPYMWKVLSGNGAVLGKDGDWEYEPIPSSRDEEFYARCRFDTYEEAEAAALKALKEEEEDA